MSRSWETLRQLRKEKVSIPRPRLGRQIKTGMAQFRAGPETLPIPDITEAERQELEEALGRKAREEKYGVIRPLRPREERRERIRQVGVTAEDVVKGVARGVSRGLTARLAEPIVKRVSVGIAKAGVGPGYTKEERAVLEKQAEKEQARVWEKEFKAETIPGKVASAAGEITGWILGPGKAYGAARRVTKAAVARAPIERLPGFTMELARRLIPGIAAGAAVFGTRDVLHDVVSEKEATEILSRLPKHYAEGAAWGALLEIPGVAYQLYGEARAKSILSAIFKKENIQPAVAKKLMRHAVVYMRKVGESPAKKAKAFKSYYDAMKKHLRERMEQAWSAKNWDEYMRLRKGLPGAWESVGAMRGGGVPSKPGPPAVRRFIDFDLSMTDRAFLNTYVGPKYRLYLRLTKEDINKNIIPALTQKLRTYRAGSKNYKMVDGYLKEFFRSGEGVGPKVPPTEAVKAPPVAKPTIQEQREALIQEKAAKGVSAGEEPKAIRLQLKRLGEGAAREGAKVLAIRMGDFYKIGKEIIPYHEMPKYMKTLPVGTKIAIAEEVEPLPKYGVVRRDITRIIERKKPPEAPAVPVGAIPKELESLAAKAVAKESWQMTREEFRNHYVAKMGTERPGFGAMGPSVLHNQVVIDALSQGKPVPPEVLADYPDLAKKAPAVTKKETLENYLNRRIEEYLAPRRIRQKEIEVLLTEKDDRRIQDIRQNPRTGQEKLVGEYNRIGKEIQQTGTREFELKLQKEYQSAVTPEVAPPKTDAQMAELAARIKRPLRAPAAVREAEAEMAREAPPAEAPPVEPPKGRPPTEPPGPPLEPPAPLKANAGKLKSKFRATAKAIKKDIDGFRFYPNTPPAFRNAVRIDFIGALDKAYNNVTGKISKDIWGGLTSKDVQKSVEIAFARDQLSRTKLGKGNPQISLEQAQQIHDTALETASAEAIASADRLKAVHDQYTRRLVQRGVLDKDQIIEDHIRHFVEDYTPEWAPTFGIPIQLKRPFRGYAKKAVGTVRTYRQDQQAIIDSLMEMEYHNLVEDFIQAQVEIYDIKPKLSQEQRRAIFGTDKRGYAKVPRPGRIYIIGGKRYRAYTPDIPFSRAIYMTAEGEAALGNFKNVALLPEDIYNTFRAFSERGGRALHLFNRATRYWKAAAILSHFPTFNVNNMIGDTWIAMAQHPNPLALLGEYNTARRYLSRRPKVGFDKRLDAFVKEQHIKQTFVRAEIAPGRQPRYLPAKLLNLLWKSSDYRESVNRVAYGASLLRAMEKGQGEAMREAHSWIDTEGLTLEDALGKISREVLTDYAAVSKTWRRALSGALTPFATFYFKTSVRAWRWMGRKPIKALLWFMLLPVISTLYNRRIWKGKRRRKEIEDLEMMLPDYVRNRVHFILGEMPDGTIRVVMPQTIQDVLIGTKIFSVVTDYANRVISGEMTPRKAALEALRHWGLEEWSGLKYLVNPWIRMIGGLHKGTDPYDKAPVYRRDRGRMTRDEIAIDTAFYIWKCTVPFFAVTIQTYQKGLPQDMAWRKLIDRWTGKGALGIYDVNKKGQVVLEIDGKKVALEWEDIHNIRKRAASEYKYLNQLEDDWVASGQEVNVFLSGKKAHQSLLKLYDVWAKHLPELKEEQSEDARIRIVGAALGKRLENVFNAQAFNKWLQVKRSRAKTKEEKRQLAERYSAIQTQRILERYKSLPKTARETYLVEKIRSTEDVKVPERPTKTWGELSKMRRTPGQAKSWEELSEERKRPKSWEELSEQRESRELEPIGAR